MKLAILCLESLALALLFTAIIYTFSGRLKNRFLRGLSRAPAFLLPFLSGVFFLGCGWEMRKNGIEPVALFNYALSWTILFLIGFVLIRRFAVVKDGDAEVCRSWPRLTLIGAGGLVLVFFSMTSLKMDADARARLVSAQTRALAQAIRLNPGSVAKDENAALIYKKLAGQVDLPNWVHKINEPDFNPEAESVRGVLDKNKKAFSLLKRAAAMSDASVVSEIGLDREWPGYRAAFPNTEGMRQAVQLLALDTYAKALNGETGSSLASIKAMGTAARHMSQTPYLITIMVAGSIIQTQKTSLERLMAFSPGISSKLISLPVENKRYLIESWRRSLAMEDAMAIYSFASDFITDRVQEVWANRSIADIFLLDVLPYRALVSEYDLAFFEKFWRKTHEISQRPVYEGFEKQKKWEQEISKESGGFYAITAGAPNISRYSINPNIAEAHQGLMDLALAAYAYYTINNRYPVQIGDLVPAYIRRVPADPFDGKPLKMIAVKDGLIFYSIGPDFKDDGGRIEYGLPYDDKKSGDLLFRMGNAYDQTFLKPALSQLAADGNLKMVRRALAAGADARRNEPIVAAAAKGHLEIVRLFLQKGADINAVAGPAKKSKRKDRRFRHSVDKGLEKNVRGLSALMAASLNGHEQAVKLLLDQGADPNVANDSGQTALMLASGTGMVDVTKWAEREMKTLYHARKSLPVLEAKIKALEIEAKGFFNKKAAQKKLARAKTQLLGTRRTIQTLENINAPSKKAVIDNGVPEITIDRIRLIKHLLSGGAAINAQDDSGTSALLAATFGGDLGAVTLLIKNGADIHLKNKLGWTPLIVASARDDRVLKNALIDQGASLAEKEQETIGRLANTLQRFKKKPTRRR